MEIKLKSTYKGTRILFGDTAKRKRELISAMSMIAGALGYSEIMIPILQLRETFASKVGEENNNMMYNLTDRGERELCLAPEYTAVVQQLQKERFKYEKDVKMFYIAECFRGENTQAGRYRQFTQFGIEVLNPTKDYLPEMIMLASQFVKLGTEDFEVNTEATRGLDYYKGGKGFEISCKKLEGSMQVCGGGEYEGGIGFAIGVDRVMLLK